jgi:hypothetical protein
MLSDSHGQSWSPSPTQSSAQVLEEDDQHQPQQESPGSEAIAFEKKWMVPVTDVGGECTFLFPLCVSSALSLTLLSSGELL